MGGDGSHLAGEAQLTDGDQTLRRGAPRDRARDGEGDGEVGGRLDETHAAHGGDVDVLVGYPDSGALLEHRKHHRHACAVDAADDAPWVGARTGQRERLHLDRKCASSLHRDGHAGARFA